MAQQRSRSRDGELPMEISTGASKQRHHYNYFFLSKSSKCAPLHCIKEGSCRQNELHSDVLSFLDVLITRKYFCLLLGEHSSQITGVTVSSSKQRNFDNCKFFKHVLGKRQNFATLFSNFVPWFITYYALLCLYNNTIYYYTYLFMQDEFGLYVYKVDVRREDEIVALFFPHFSLLLILYGHLRARNGILKRACVIWGSN